jgi:hypothetical protein
MQNESIELTGDVERSPEVLGRLLSIQFSWDNYLHLWQRSVHHLVEVMCTDDGHDSVLQKYLTIIYILHHIS